MSPMADPFIETCYNDIVQLTSARKRRFEREQAPRPLRRTRSRRSPPGPELCSIACITHFSVPEKCLGARRMHINSMGADC